MLEKDSVAGDGGDSVARNFGWPLGAVSQPLRT